MLSLNRSYGKIYPNFSIFARLFSLNSNNVTNVLDFIKGFSAPQHIKILETLNKSSPEELSKYNLPLGHIQHIMNWKSRKGLFMSLEEVLEVEGFGEKILREFSESITIHNDGNEVENKKTNFKKQIKQLIVPDISLDILSSIKSAVAIHLEPPGIGWARLENKDNSLTSWKCENFSSLPQKMMSVDNFNLALNILKKTPPGDVYIFEYSNNLGLQAQGKQATVSTYNQKAELVSMLLALINTSVIHNKSLQRDNQEPLRVIENRVFYLKSNIPARVFGTLIGSEKVSAVTAIHKLLQYHLEDSDPLPYTPVIFQDNLRRSFFNQGSTNKELLAQALMLGVSFMDLCLRNLSYESLNFHKGRKKKSS